MQIACPSCERKNHKRLQKCMYCGATLREQAEVMAASAEAQVDATEASSELRLLYISTPQMELGPPESWPPGLLESFCRLSGLDGYTARQRLLSGLPFLLPSLPPEAVPATLTELQSAGFVASAIPLGDVVSLPPKAPVLQAEWDAQSLRLTGLEQAPLATLDAPQLCLLIYSRVQRSQKSEFETSELVYRGGGIGQNYAREYRTERKSHQQDIFLLDLYATDGRSYRIHSQQSDLKHFGDPLTMSTPQIFDNIVQQLQLSFPHIHVDRGFRSGSQLKQYIPKSFRQMSSSQGMLHMLGKNISQSDDLPEFEFYSRLLFCHRHPKQQALQLSP